MTGQQCIEIYKEWHLRKALANEQLASTLPLSESAVEWAITVLFYAAVHYVQAYFALDGRSYTSHPAPNKAIARDPVISVVSDAYESLYNLTEMPATK